MMAHRRTQGLLVEEMAEETVVYDKTRHEAHCLNRVAAFVWKHCDGRTSTAEMVRLLREELDQTADETTVRLIVEHLEVSHLLRELSERPTGVARHTRRKTAKDLAALGLTGLLLSIPVPVAAQAVSCKGLGQVCQNNGQCCSGTCSGGGGTKFCV